MTAEPTRARRKVTRRRFVRWAAGGAGALAVGSALDAFILEPRWLKLTRREIALRRLPAAWNALRIVHITDLHRGELIDLNYLRRVFDAANSAQPDLVALTGDFVDNAAAIDDGYAEALASLKAPLGVYAVPGNHDHWTGIAGVRKMFARAGVIDLSNAHRLLDRAGQPLCLAGVDDLWEGPPDLEAALRGAPAEAARLLLCHNPDFAETMPAAPRVDLMLCGHTHGGQVKVPFGPRPCLPIRHAKYAAGLAQGPHCPVYTSVGVGVQGLDVRFNCRPEVAILTLRSA